MLSDATVNAATLGRTDVVVERVGNELMEQRPRTVTAGDDDPAPLEFVEGAGDRGRVQLRQLGHEFEVGQPDPVQHRHDLGDPPALG